MSNKYDDDDGLEIDTTVQEGTSNDSVSKMQNVHNRDVTHLSYRMTTNAQITRGYEKLYSI